MALAPHPEVRTPAAEDAVSVGPTQATVTAITAVTGTSTALVRAAILCTRHTTEGKR